MSEATPQIAFCQTLAEKRDKAVSSGQPVPANASIEVRLPSDSVAMDHPIGWHANGGLPIRQLVVGLWAGFLNHDCNGL